jgi:hypothetical protein
MERPTHQVGKPCVSALKHVFELVSASGFPDSFDDEPSLGAAHVVGDRATITVRGRRQTNTLRLRRIDGEWKNLRRIRLSLSQDRFCFGRAGRSSG